MEVRTRSLCRTATPRRRPGSGSANCRRPTWPLADRKQPRACHCPAKQLLRFTRLGFRRGTATCIIRRTAGYGPVCPVVWEGRSRRLCKSWSHSTDARSGLRRENVRKRNNSGGAVRPIWPELGATLQSERQHSLAGAVPRIGRRSMTFELARQRNITGNTFGSHRKAEQVGRDPTDVRHEGAPFNCRLTICGVRKRCGLAPCMMSLHDGMLVTTMRTARCPSDIASHARTGTIVRCRTARLSNRKVDFLRRNSLIPPQ